MSATVVGTAAETPVGNGGDPIPEKFLFATLVFRRARQLRDGARPRVDARDHKILRVAFLEVMAGVIR